MTVAERPDSPTLLTVEEAAERLRISRASAYNLIKRGDLEMVPVYGNRRRVLAASVDAYIERRREGR